MPKTKYKPIIGLEIHAELATKSKMFCGCDVEHFAVKPNTHTCPVCLGLPGALPVPNRKAVDWTIMIGLALNCSVKRESKFDRKHYFYPDLPKGYQISQYDEPLCVGGFLEMNEGKVRITRVHLEEDTGKLLHKKIKGKNVTLVDFNRSGVPLVEIVTEPDIHSATQAKEFAQKLKQILRHLEVSDCDMEKGSMRLEANISLSKLKTQNSPARKSLAPAPQYQSLAGGLQAPAGGNLKARLPDYKVEVKNLNSFRFVEKAINYEISRQKKILERGKTPKQETRGWDEKKGVTIPQRSKETAADYRYFPEPDIPPMRFSDTEIRSLKQQIPELPDDIAKKLQQKFGVRKDYVQQLVVDSTLAKNSLATLSLAKKAGLEPNTVAGVIVNQKIDFTKIKPSRFIEDLSSKKSKTVRNRELLDVWIEDAVKASPQAVSDFKKGKLNAIGVVIGKVMQLSGGKADASSVKNILEKKLS